MSVSWSFRRFIIRGLRGFSRGPFFLHLFARRSPRFTLAAWTALVLLACIPLMNVRSVISVHDLLPGDYESVRNMEALDRNFSTGRQVNFVARTSRDGFSEKELCQMRRFLSDGLFGDPALVAASSPFDLVRVNDFDGKFFYRPLLALNCESPSDKPDLAAWKTLRDSPFAGLFVSKNSSRVLSFELSYDKVVSDPAFGAFAPEKREEILRTARKTVDSPHVEITVSGAGTYESFLVDGMRVYGIVNVLIVIFVVLAFRFLYGTWLSSGLFIATLIGGVVLTFGFVGLSGRPIDILSNSLFVMTAVAALQDFAYLTAAVRKGQLWEQYRRLLVPSFFTSFTTMIGFGSLAVSDIESVRWFGVWAATAAFLEWVMLFAVMPAALTIWPSLQNWTKPEPHRWLSSIGGWWDRMWFGVVRRRSYRALRLAGLLLFVAVFPLGIFSAKVLNVADDPKRMLPASHEFRVELDELKRDLGWEFPASVVLRNARDFETMKQITEKLRGLDGVVHVESLSDIVTWTSKGLDSETANVVERDVALRGMTRRYQGSEGIGRIVIYLRTASLDDIARLTREIDGGICAQAGCYLAGEVVAYADFVRSISETLFESLISGLFSVILLILLVCYIRIEPELFPKAAPRLLLSALWGPCAMLTLLALSQVALNMVTLICASVVVGLTGDNAIQFLFAGRARTLVQLDAQMDVRSEGAFTTGLTTALASLVFLASYFDPPRVLGILLAICFFNSMIGDVQGLRLLISRRR